MTAEKAVAELVRAGAALTPTLAGVAVPVGLMQRIGEDRWFWFAAGGETEFDGHVINAEARVLYDGMAVEFHRGETFAGYLTTFTESFDEEAAVASRRVLADWRARYDVDPALRGFIARQITALRS